MQTSLRKMGNSTGLIVPRKMLETMGVTTGTAMDLSIQDGKLVAAPVERSTRDGWAIAAAALPDDDAGEWRGFGNDGDDALTW